MKLAKGVYVEPDVGAGIFFESINETSRISALNSFISDIEGHAYTFFFRSSLRVLADVINRSIYTIPEEVSQIKQLTPVFEGTSNILESSLGNICEVIGG